MSCTLQRKYHEALVFACMMLCLAPWSPAASEGDFTLEAPQHLVTLMQKLQSSELRDMLQVPVMVMVAAQSAGKSLFVDHIAGYPVTYSDPRMATMCPVRYSFRQSATKQCTVGERADGTRNVVALKDVAREVRQHMQAQNGIISEKELLVVIEDPNVLPMDIIDLPGFPKKEAPHYARTVELIQSAVRKENVIIVTVCRGEAVDPESQMHTQLLDEVISPARPGWKEDHIMIQNFVNAALKDIFEVAVLERYFSVPLEANPDTFFVLMNPNHDDLGHMDAASKKSLYRATRNGGEQARFEKEVARIESARGRKDTFAKKGEIMKHLGVSRAHEALRNRLLSAVTDGLGQLKDRVRAMKVEHQLGLDVLEQALKMSDIDQLRRAYTDYVTGYVASFRALTDSKRTVIRQTSGEMYEGSDVALEPMSYSDTFPAEFDAIKGRMETAYRTVLTHVASHTAKLRESIAKESESRTSLSKRLDMKLGGDAAMARLLHMFGSVLLLQAVETCPKDELFNVCAAQLGAASMVCDVKKAIQHIMSKAVMQARKAVPWLCVHLEYLLTKRGRDAMAFRSTLDDTRAIETHAGFFRFLSTEMEKLVTSHIQRLQRDVRSMIDEHEAAMRLDAPQRLMAAVALMPTDRFSRGARRAEAPLGETEKHELRETPLGEMRDPSTLQSGESFVTRQGKFADLRDALYKLRSSFTILDAVEGGTVEITDQPYIDMEPDVIHEMAQKHVFLAKLDVLQGIERIVNARLAQYFKNHYLNDFQKKMTDAVGNITAEEAAKWRVDAVPFETLEARRAEKRKTLDHLGAVEDAMVAFDAATKQR